MHAEAQQGDVIASLRDEVSMRDDQIKSLRADLAALQAEQPEHEPGGAEHADSARGGGGDQSTRVDIPA